jgi:hypothetical protein
VSFDRTGDTLFAVMTNPRGGAPFVYRFGFTADGLTQPEVWYNAGNMLQATISAHPAGTECLVLSYRKAQSGAIWDLIFRMQGPDMFPVSYADAPGIPEAGRPDTWYGLSPFYSWDGTRVIVPLKHEGLCVVDCKGRTARYAAYPKLPFAPAALACGALPDADAKRRIWASFFLPGSREDKCQLYALDLASMSWTKVFETNWIIFHVAGKDLDREPWVVAGARAPSNGVEGRRFARYARIDPASGAQDLLEFYGAPDFDVALEPSGEYIAYTDAERKAIVRLKLATGEEDVDPRWYDTDAKVFIGAGGDPVYAWKGGVLVRAEFSRHEKFQGLEE